MAKRTEDYVLDGAGARLAEGTRQYVLSGEPANYAGLAALTLAQVDLTPGIGGGDFTASNGDTSGRKVTVAQQANVPISASGTGNHVAIADVGNTRLLAVTVCTPQVLTGGGQVTIPQWDAEWNDPT